MCYNLDSPGLDKVCQLLALLLPFLLSHRLLPCVSFSLFQELLSLGPGLLQLSTFARVKIGDLQKSVITKFYRFFVPVCGSKIGSQW